MKFDKDNTPVGMQTPEGAAKVNVALEALESRTHTVVDETDRFFCNWGSALRELVSRSYLHDIGGELDAVLEANEERKKAVNQLLRAVSGK